MDSYRVISAEHERFDANACSNGSGDDDIGHESPPVGVGQDERRMQVRAYNYWTSLLGSRNFPQIGDLISGETPDFAENAVVLDFSNSSENPAVTKLGKKLAEECGANTTIKRMSDIPGRSLLSRITDHYMQILTNQAPIGFEAEFINLRGKTVVYRGILLPFSSDGETIRHVMGVINWKELADPVTTAELIRELGSVAVADHSRVHPSLGEWADGPALAECCDLGAASSAESEPGDWLASARKLPTIGWGDISATGSEFTMLLVHRTLEGPLRLLGEVHGDAYWIERAGRHLLS